MIRPGASGFAGAVGLLLVVCAAVHLTQGRAVGMGTGDVLDVLLARLGLGDPVPEVHDTIVMYSRLPRLVLAMVAGASLAVAGAGMQAVFRNPLASPEIIGTSYGAALGGVLAIVAGVHLLSVHAVPVASFACAAAVTLAVFLFAGRGARFSIASLLLAGIAINTLVGSLISFVTTFAFRDFSRSGDVLFWLMGGLDGRGWDNILTSTGGLVVFGLALVPFVRDLDLLTLRDDSAISLGVDAARVRRTVVLIACGLTATTVANTGGITFIGLVVPHMTRLAVGPAHRRLIPCTALLGALVLVLADTVCRLSPPGANLRLGVVTSLLGAPFFLWLLVRHRRGESL